VSSIGDWSREAPTEPGWYWYCEPGDVHPKAAEVGRAIGISETYVAFFTRGKKYFVDTLDGFWQPMNEPALPWDLPLGQADLEAGR
jgi:hypothetical protein